VGSNIRFRYSYSGSGWSVRLIDPAKTEPKRDARRLRPLAVVLGASALVCIVAGFAILSQRLTRTDQTAVEKVSREEFIVPSPVMPADMVGSIPGIAPTATVTPEPEAATVSSPPEPQPIAEAARPSPAETPAAQAGAPAVRSREVIRRPVQRPRERELRGQVARIVLASGPDADAQSDPINSPIVVGPGQQKRVALYTELRDLAGQTVSHRWERDGQTMAVIAFKVGGDRWRVHSSKMLTPASKGSWRVVVADSQGAILAGRSFAVR
jgi:hypothetical protein